MNKYIPREKLSKKARRDLDSQQRLTWNGISPVTRKVESKKVYNRKKAQIGFDDSCYEPFIFVMMHFTFIFMNTLSCYEQAISYKKAKTGG